MKKLIPILLALVLAVSFTACNPPNEYVERAKANKYLSVFNTSWGMSVDECLDALKLKKSDVKMAPNVYSEDKNQFATYETFTIDKELFGKKQRLHLSL